MISRVANFTIANSSLNSIAVFEIPLDNTVYFKVVNFTIDNCVLSSSSVFHTNNYWVSAPSNINPGVTNGFQECNIQVENFTFYNNIVTQSNVLSYIAGTSGYSGSVFNVINLTQWNISSCNFTSSNVFISKLLFNIWLASRSRENSCEQPDIQ